MSDLVGNPDCWFSHTRAHTLHVSLFVKWLDEAFETNIIDLTKEEKKCCFIVP